jgi:hypothetical protein
MNLRETRAVEDVIYFLTQGHVDTAILLLRHMQKEQLELMAADPSDPGDRR